MDNFLGVTNNDNPNGRINSSDMASLMKSPDTAESILMYCQDDDILTSDERRAISSLALCQALIARLPEKYKNLSIDPESRAAKDGYNQALTEAEQVIREYFNQEGK